MEMNVPNTPPVVYDDLLEGSQLLEDDTKQLDMRQRILEQEIELVERIEMATEDGVSEQDVISVESHFPGLLVDDYPSGGFTTKRSAQNLGAFRQSLAKHKASLHRQQSVAMEGFLQNLTKKIGDWWTNTEKGIQAQVAEAKELLAVIEKFKFKDYQYKFAAKIKVDHFDKISYNGSIDVEDLLLGHGNISKIERTLVDVADEGIRILNRQTLSIVNDKTIANKAGKIKEAATDMVAALDKYADLESKVTLLPGELMLTFQGPGKGWKLVPGNKEPFSETECDLPKSEEMAILLKGIVKDGNLYLKSNNLEKALLDDMTKIQGRLPPHLGIVMNMFNQWAIGAAVEPTIQLSKHRHSTNRVFLAYAKAALKGYDKLQRGSNQK